MNSTLSRRERAQVCFDAGAMQLGQRLFAAAADEFSKAIALNPAHAKAHLGHAQAVRNLGDWPAAERSARAALDADPGCADAAHYLGALLIEMDRTAEALPFLQSAAAWKPDVAQIQRDLGVALIFLGDVAAGREHLDRTLALDVHSHEVLYTLVRMTRMGDGSPQAERLFEIARELVGRAGELPPAERTQVLFALAKAHEDRGEYVEAAKVLERANATKRAAITYDPGAAATRMRRLAQVFDKGMIERLARFGSTSERPIFIVGMPRSGSTLVEQILAAHPEVFGGGELFHLPTILDGSRGPGGARYPAWVATMNGVDCAAIAGAYLGMLPAGLPGQTRVTDKWLENFESLGLLSVCLPRAKIIHCHRDPRDQLLSCWSILFSQNQEYAYDIDELRRYYAAYRELMAYWRTVLPAGAMLEVSYEALVAEPETWARAILAHCGLEWDDHVLSFWQAKRAVKSASMAQVREPVYDRSIGRWRAFAEPLGPLFEGLEA